MTTDIILERREYRPAQASCGPESPWPTSDQILQQAAADRAKERINKNQSAMLESSNSQQ